MVDTTSEAAFALLHELRLRGMVEGAAGSAVETLLRDGMAVEKGVFLALTALGREAAEVRARLPDGSEEESSAQRAYEAFLPLNGELLKVSTDWQVRPGGVPNDHSDAAYDWEVIDRLRDLDERAGPTVRRLGQSVERFSGYRDRLRDARRMVEDGGHDWFCSPRCDSYHTVWMQLHEDLLLGLGIDRGTEAGG